MQADISKYFVTNAVALLVLVLFPVICFAYTEGDINNDDKIGLQETIYSLQVAAGLSIPLSGTTINVPADIPTIQEAIDAANEGDTVNIAAGTFTESLSINGKSIVLTGAGENNTFLDGDGQHVLTVEHSPGVLIENMTVQNGDKGILVLNNSSVEITLVTVKDCSNRGIQLWNNSSAEVSDSTIDNSGRDGIGVLQGSNLTLSGTVTTENNTRHGLMAFLGSTIFIDNAVFSSNLNSGRGISLSDNSGLYISASTVGVVDNGDDGIQASGSSTIGASDGTTITVEVSNSAPQGTGDDGINILDVSRIWSEAAITVRGVPGNGINASGGSDFGLSGQAIVQDCGESGFLLSRGASAYISVRLEIISCTYDGIAIGQGSSFFTSDTGQVIVRDTRPANQGIGIGVYENSILRANGGTFLITGNEQSGIEVGRHSTLSLRDKGAGLDANISTNGYGINAWQTATLRIGDGAVISNNSGTGIYLGQISSGDIRDVTIQNNGDWGISVDDGSSLKLENSAINTNTAGSIELSFGSRANLSGNTLSPASLSCDASVLSRGDLNCP